MEEKKANHSLDYVTHAANEKFEGIDTKDQTATGYSDGEVLSTFISPLSGREVKIRANDVDEAMKLADELDQEHVVYDPVKDRKLLRKIDFALLPLVCFLYACQFMDKTTSSNAAIMGLKTDLKMHGDQYSWCGTAFYLGYLVFEFPANALLQRFPLAKTTALFIFLWGAILCIHAAPKTYAGFIALRTILGVLESSISPAMVILTGQWYRKEEQFLRTALWFSCNGFGSIIGASIAYGCDIHGANYDIDPWRVLFIVTGLMTIVISIVFVFHIPDNPSKAWFLTKEEKLMVIARIKDNKQGFGNKHFKIYQFKEALLDPLTWLYFFFAVASNIPNGSLTSFSAILLNDDFNYSSKQALLENMWTGFVEVIGCILLASLTKWIPHRMFISLVAMIIAFFSSCMLAFADQNKVARLTGYFLQYVYPTTTICALSCFQSNTAGHTKKITVTALFFIGYCVGNIVGPQTFISEQAPGYVGGKISIVVCNAATLFFIVAIYAWYYYMNKKKDAKVKEMDLSKFDAIENSEFADLTDKENPHFRYCL